MSPDKWGILPVHSEVFHLHILLTAMANTANITNNFMACLTPYLTWSYRQISHVARRNLTLLSKALQSASNGKFPKETYLECLNDFITVNSKKFEQYFTLVAAEGPRCVANGVLYV
jgi:hypothetical protein